MHTRFRKNISRSLAAGGILTLAIAAAPVASAHVTANPDKTEAGSYALVSFSVPHGCDGSATTKVQISIPDEINAVTPTVNHGWDLEKVTEKLSEPTTDSHGNKVEERVKEIVYTAHDPLPADYRDAFDLSMKLPEDAADQTLYFPTVQTCEKGESAWVQIPEEGQNPHSLELPSPELHVTAASEDSSEAVTTAESEAGQSSSNGWSISALVVGIIALIVGVAALVRGGRRQ